MDFSLSEAQTEIAGLARKILAEQDSAPRQWTDLAAAGVLAAGLPEPLGGAGPGPGGLVAPRRGRRARRRAARAARRRGPGLPRAVLGARRGRPGRVAPPLPFVARARRGRDRRIL